MTLYLNNTLIDCEYHIQSDDEIWIEEGYEFEAGENRGNDGGE